MIVAPARAGLVCDTLGIAGRFVAVAERSLTTRITRGFQNEPVGSRFQGAVCTTRASLQGIRITGDGPFGADAPAIATAPTGTAVRIRSFRDEGTSAGNFFDGDIVTGGGRVSGTPTEQFGTIDTTGADARVSSCAAAFVAARDASAAFASLTPTATLGSVFVRRGDELLIDGHGGAVVQIDELRTEPAGRKFGGFPRLCNVAGVTPASVRIVGDPGDQIVINAGRFRLGSCTVVRVEGASDVLVNVPGKGPAVQMGYGTGGGNLGDQLAILAPERAFQMDAGTDDDDANRVVAFWAGRAKMNGNTQVVDSGLADCPPR